MSPRHHLSEATLLSHAAGALPAALAIVAATHLSFCGACRRQLRLAERIGGGLMALQHEATPPGAREAMLARLDASPDLEPAIQSNDVAIHANTLPAPLHPYFGRSLDRLAWRWMGPGMRWVRTRVGEGMVLMLRIAPGKGLPKHGHRGGELTCVLQGAYEDEFGLFSPGDVADLDSHDWHRPLMASNVPCICVVGLDGGLTYEGWFPRVLQPLLKL
ncbi:ChrR family anti-sigma-E factor [Frateuria sp. GZRe12]|uniref:ChrR family anti-sigma-E factor n=1 Tax=Frateuria sp. GZRe12 TaxID=3351533 RepID=UPI003EDB8457